MRSRLMLLPDKPLDVTFPLTVYPANDALLLKGEDQLATSRPFGSKIDVVIGVDLLDSATVEQKMFSVVHVSTLQLVQVAPQHSKEAYIGSNSYASSSALWSLLLIAAIFLIVAQVKSHNWPFQSTKKTRRDCFPAPASTVDNHEKANSTATDYAVPNKLSACVPNDTCEPSSVPRRRRVRRSTTATANELRQRQKELDARMLAAVVAERKKAEERSLRSTQAMSQETVLVSTPAESSRARNRNSAKRVQKSQPRSVVPQPGATATAVAAVATPTAHMSSSLSFKHDFADIDADVVDMILEAHSGDHARTVLTLQGMTGLSKSAPSPHQQPKRACLPSPRVRTSEKAGKVFLPSKSSASTPPPPGRVRADLIGHARINTYVNISHAWL